MKLNLPCKITLIRIALIPFVLFFYLTNLFSATKIVALCIFIFACCTDFIDGYIARKYNLVTNLGKFLDPIADKLIATAGILLIVVSNDLFIQPWGLLLAFIMISRDTIVNLIRQMGATKGIVIAADRLGKLKTIALNIFIPIFMLVDANKSLLFMPNLLLNVMLTLGYLFAIVFTVLTVSSVINYIIKNKQIFK